MQLTSPPGAPTGSAILGLGDYQPDTIVTNDDLAARGVDTTDEWVRSRIGIESRRYAREDETVVDMAEAAGAKAIAASGVSVDDIDLVIVASCTMPTPVPNASAQLATRLGISAPGAYDINAGCAGFVYALSSASNAVLTGAAHNVLVVGSERFSGWLDFTDRATCVILADGAGAAVVGPADHIAIGPVVWGSDGAQAEAISIDEDSHFFRQEGQAVFRWATTKVAPVALEACERAGVDPSELSALVPHQANLRIIDHIAKKVGAVNAVVAHDIVTAGNTSAASIPLALSRMVGRGEIPSGSPVLIVGFGAGLTYAAQVVLAP